jgi:excisionase family DNA binding protein
VAETLRISRRQIEKLLKEGAFPIPRLRGLGKRNRWSRASVERYLGGKPN